MGILFSLSRTFTRTGMYVSPAVRSMLDHPVDEAVTLVLGLADEPATGDVAEQVRECGGHVERHLEFQSLAVSIEQDDVAGLCEIDGIDSIETANTLSMTLDGAGEDVRPGGD